MTAQQTSAVELESSTGLSALLVELRADYERAHSRSRTLYERATQSLPGGNSRSQLYFEPFPFYVERAAGAYLTDVEGHSYVDMVNNYTSLVHGHPTDDELLDQIAERIRFGSVLGAPSPLELELAEEVRARIPSIERIRFTNSGTEATMYALRTARAFTGRDEIIKIEGGYHGGHDAVQVTVRRFGGPSESIPEVGIPQHVAQMTHVIPFNDTAAAVAIIRHVGKRAAALIAEPLQSSGGWIAGDKAYWRGLRDVTREVGCLLILDEIQTFRLAYGGAQEMFGIDPDLTALGKLIGGGFPIGAFGGRADVMNVADPRRSGQMIHSGTFNANPVSLAAGLAYLRRLTREQIAEINARGDRIRELMNEACRAHNVNAVATGVGSLLQLQPGRIAPKDSREAASRSRRLFVNAAFHLLLKEGVFISPGGATMNVSTAMTNHELRRVESALDHTLSVLGRLRG